MGFSIARYAEDSRARQAARRFAQAAGIDRGRPDETFAMASEPAGDLAVAVAVSAVLSGARAASPETLSAANSLMASATAARPGWAYHRYLLGRTDPEKAGERSRRALRLAASGAPGMDVIWSELARAQLEGWSDLSAAGRSEAPEIFRRAFRSETFVTAAIASVAGVLGQSRALSLLPEDAEVLDAAAGIFAQRADVPGASLLLARADAAERREREEGLAELERRAGLGDIEGLYAGCRAWFDAHPYEDLDDTAGRRQVARLLALWPDIRFGSWSRDRRARLLRFFLDGRTSAVSAEALARTIESLTGVPDAVRAHVYLLAGNLPAAQGLARSTGQVGSFEWDPYSLELSRRMLSAGKHAEARAALMRLSLPARDGCEALLARRALARAAQDSGELAVVQERLAVLRQTVSGEWGSRGALSVCVDSEGNGETLEVSVGSGSPALIAYGFDGGRAGTISVAGEGGSFRVALTGLAGQRTLWASFLIGGGDRSLHASLKAAS
jgi:hypothetical protein